MSENKKQAATGRTARRSLGTIKYLLKSEGGEKVKRVKGKAATPIKNILSDTMGAIAARESGTISKEEISRIWRDVAGGGAANHSSPRQFKKNTLTINVDSPIWIYQINIKKAQIEKELTRRLKQKEPVCIRLRAGED